MKKLSSVLIAVLACLAIGSIAVAVAASGGGKDVATKVTLKFKDPGDDPYGQNEFDGVVKAKKGCDAGRKVVVKGAGDAKSSKSGKYSITTSSSVSGEYQAKVKKGTVKDGKKTITCAAGKSKTITVP
jgi:hypothetical protein